jgi:hypothetical protein
MRKHKAIAALTVAVSLLLPFASPVWAEDAQLLDSVFENKTVPTDVMSAQRGKAVITLMDVDGTVAENAAINTVSGRNVVTGGSFANSGGIVTSIQNSGNNVLIQNATILQLDVR